MDTDVPLGTILSITSIYYSSNTPSVLQQHPRTSASSQKPSAYARQFFLRSVKVSRRQVPRPLLPLLRGRGDSTSLVLSAQFGVTWLAVPAQKLLAHPPAIKIEMIRVESAYERSWSRELLQLPPVVQDSAAKSPFFGEFED